MLIVILILVCLLFFFNLLMLGQLVLIKKRYSLEKIVSRLPVVTKEVLSTVGREMQRAIDKKTALDQYAKWMGSLGSENPILAIFIQALPKEIQSSIGGLTVYQALKAQAEADSLADLTKIQK